MARKPSKAQAAATAEASTAEALRTIDAAMQAEPGYAMIERETIKSAVDAGYVVCNEGIVNGTQIACRLTETGIIEARKQPMTDTNTAPAAPAAAPAAAPTFALVSNVPVASIKRGGGGGVTGQAKYPFDQMELGMSFFVPATAELENPAKSLASTVSSASRRYAEEVGSRSITRAKRGGAEGEKETVTIPTFKYERFFIVRSIEDGKDWGQPGVKGAAVYRVDPAQYAPKLDNTPAAPAA